MPTLPKKICRHPGCNSVTDSKYCAVHAPMHSAMFENAETFNYKRKTSTQRGYNSRWRKASKMFLKEHPLCECEECVKYGRLKTANVVHHIVPHRGNYELFWDDRNWQAMNKRCHDRHTFRETRKGINNKMSWEGYRFDSEGEMVPVKVYLIWGAPASGKTTYVREHMQEGDMVVDLDMIKQSIGMVGKTEAWDLLLETAIGIRDYLYDLIDKRKIKTNVWVIAGLPTKQERDAVIKKIRPDDIKFIDATQDKCIEQAIKDVSRVDKERQLDIIRKWFKRYYGD